MSEPDIDQLHAVVRTLNDLQKAWGEQSPAACDYIEDAIKLLDYAADQAIDDGVL